MAQSPAPWIGAFQTVIRSVLLPLTAELSTTLPGVEVHIKETDEADGMGDLRAGRIDLLILNATLRPAHHRAFRYRTFIDEPGTPQPRERPARANRTISRKSVNPARPQTIGYHACKGSPRSPAWVPKMQLRETPRTPSSGRMRLHNSADGGTRGDGTACASPGSGIQFRILVRHLG